VRCCRKKFTFAISSPDEFLLYNETLQQTSLLVLCCRNCMKDDKFRHLIPLFLDWSPLDLEAVTDIRSGHPASICKYFEEVKGGIEPWLMARWKARERLPIRRNWTFSLALTVQALQGKMCQDSLLSGVGRSLGAKISGERGRPWGIFFLVSTKLDTFCYLTVQTAPCYVPSFWHNTVVWQTDRQTDRQTELP